MLALLRVALRSFAIGVGVGVLFAPRPGAETRRILARRLNAAIGGILELAATPPVASARARANGHSQRPARRGRRASVAHDPNARSS